MPVNVANLENIWLRRIAQTCRELPAQYFNVPVAGGPQTKKFERIYCYEMYHLFRQQGLSMAGELPKGGHPNWGTHLGLIQPDLLCYSLEAQHFSIQVKLSNRVTIQKYGGQDEINIIHDLGSLKRLAQAPSSYECNVLLVYGPRRIRFPRQQQVLDWLEQHLDGLPIYVLWHFEPHRLRLLIGNEFQEINFN